MTSTANNTQPQQDETPLTWTSRKEWGSEGLTHRSETTIHGERWTFTVDSPSKGQWVARAWRDGDMALYREDRTMKGAKQQAQAHANYAATATCTECRKIGGHKLDCATGRAADVARSAEHGERTGLRAEDAPVVLVDEGAELLTVTEPAEDRIKVYGTELGPAVLDRLDPAQAQQLMAELEETFPHLAEWKRNVLGDRIERLGRQLGQVADQMAATLGPAMVSASEAASRMAAAVLRVQGARDRVQLRKDTCGCLTPLHTMRCGVGGRVRVIPRPRSTVSVIIGQGECQGPCCGGDGPVNYDH